MTHLATTEGKQIIVLLKVIFVDETAFFCLLPQLIAKLAACTDSKNQKLFKCLQNHSEALPISKLDSTCFDRKGSLHFSLDHQFRIGAEPW